MNKKILFGSIFAAFLMVSIPFVSVAQEQQADETQTTELMTMEALIRNLQDLHDGCKENFADEFEDGFLEDFQDQIDILSETSDGFFCRILDNPFVKVLTLQAYATQRQTLIKAVAVATSYSIKAIITLVSGLS